MDATRSLPGKDFEDQSKKPAAWLSHEELKEFSKINHRFVIIHVSLTWLLIFIALELAIIAANSLPFFAAFIIGLLAFIFIGCMQNGLISWTHEASHYNLTRNKRLNDILADLFIAGPAGASVAAYRQHHVLHHRYLGDPEKEIAVELWLCIRGGYLYSAIIRYMLGFNAFRMIFRYLGMTPIDKKDSGLVARSLESIIGFGLGNLFLFAFCALQGYWYFYILLWIAPLFTIALLVSNFRTIVEHQPSTDVCDVGMVQLPNMTRVIRSNPLERWLVAPIGFYYHHEHHMYPGIPYHRLAEVRNVLSERGYFERPEIVWGDGYVRTIWKLAQEPEYGIRLLNPLHQFEHDDDHAHVEAEYPSDFDENYN